MKKILLVIILTLIANPNLFAIEFKSASYLPNHYLYIEYEMNGLFRREEAKLKDFLSQAESENKTDANAYQSDIYLIPELMPPTLVYFIYEHFQRNPNATEQFPLAYKYIYSTEEVVSKHNELLTDPYHFLVTSAKKKEINKLFDKLTKASEEVDNHAIVKLLSYTSVTQALLEYFLIGDVYLGGNTFSQNFIQAGLEQRLSSTENNLPFGYYLLFSFFEHHPKKQAKYSNLYQYLKTNEKVQKEIPLFKSDPYSFLRDQALIDLLFK